MIRKLAAPFLLLALILPLVSCANKEITPQTPVLTARLITVQSLNEADQALGVAWKFFDGYCPTAPQGALPVCRSFRQFVEGTNPKAAICAAPKVDALGQVFKECGYNKGFPVLASLYFANANDLSKISQAVADQAQALINTIRGYSAEVVKASGGALNPFERALALNGGS